MAGFAGPPPPRCSSAFFLPSPAARPRAAQPSPRAAGSAFTSRLPLPHGRGPPDATAPPGKERVAEQRPAQAPQQRHRVQDRGLQVPAPQGEVRGGRDVSRQRFQQDCRQRQSPQGSGSTLERTVAAATNTSPMGCARPARPAAAIPTAFGGTPAGVSVAEASAANHAAGHSGARATVATKANGKPAAPNRP